MDQGEGQDHRQIHDLELFFSFPWEKINIFIDHIFNHISLQLSDRREAPRLSSMTSMLNSGTSVYPYEDVTDLIDAATEGMSHFITKHVVVAVECRK